MVIIVGGGPVGSFAAYNLARKGHDVKLFEEHAKIGLPIQCTGIVTDSINKIYKVPKDAIVNQVSVARVYSPDGNNVEVKMRNHNLILDRARFDSGLAQLALDAGAKISTGSKFQSIDDRGINIKSGKITNVVSDKILVGADGPNSSVAKSFGIFGNRQFLYGIQAVCKLENDNSVQFYPYIDTFGWVVPVDFKTVRVGVLAYGDSVKSFWRLMKTVGIRKDQIHAMQGGVVPIYNQKLPIQAKVLGTDVYLIGDAACQVKATTGGGIIQGLTAAKCLTESISKGTSYSELIGKEMGRDLRLHSLMRKAMDKFSDSDWNDVVDIFNKPKNKRIISDFDRDYPSRFVLGLGFMEPRLWKYAFKLI